MKRPIVFLLMLAAALVLLRAPGFAQVDRGSVTGTALDPSGAAVPEATLEIRNLDTGFVARTSSTGSGAFTFIGLPLGRYTMTAQKDGFQPWQVAEFRLSVGEIRKLDVNFAIQAQATVVQVEEYQAIVEDQTSARQGIVVGEKEMKSIPVNGRDWSAYMLLAPGAVDSGGGSQRSIRIMGRSKDDNNFVFDGIDATGVKEGPHLVALRNQDDIKVRPNLTLSIGVRYESYIPVYKVNGRVKIYSDGCGGFCPKGTALYE